MVDAGYPAQMSAQLHSLPPAAANLRPSAGLHTRQTLHCLFWVKTDLVFKLLSYMVTVDTNSLHLDNVDNCIMYVYC